MLVAHQLTSDLRVLSILALSVLAVPLAAGVTRIEIEKTLPFAAGRSFDGIERP